MSQRSQVLPRCVHCVHYSLTQEISRILSRGSANKYAGKSKYNPCFSFDYVYAGKPTEFIFTSVSGHVMEMVFTGETKRWDGIDPSALMTIPIEKVPSKSAASIIRQLEIEAGRADELVLWTDCDREGENIGAEIAQIVSRRRRTVNVHRARFSAVTPQAVRAALDGLTGLNAALANAADVRSEVDLRIGAAFTRMLTLNARRRLGDRAPKLLSYGPCQVPTLGIIVDAAIERDGFAPEQFWELGLSAIIDGMDTPTAFTWDRGRLFDETAATILFDRIRGRPAVLTSVQQTTRTVRKPRPLDTIGLQRLMSTRYRMSPHKTMKVAEGLYTRGALSYPRTDTTRFDPTMNLAGLLHTLAADDKCRESINRLRHLNSVTGDSPEPRTDGQSDGAHPPIHTTGPPPARMSGDEGLVYWAVFRSLMAALAPDGLDGRVEVRAGVGHEGFGATFTSTVQLGWREFSEYSRDHARQGGPGRPDPSRLRPGTAMQRTDVALRASVTRPPDALTEAGLVQQMATCGIGTDATTAQHIKMVQDRGYARVDGGTITPTPLGTGLVTGLRHCGPAASALVDPAGRALTETRTRRVALGMARAADVVQAAVGGTAGAWGEVCRGVDAVMAGLG